MGTDRYTASVGDCEYSNGDNIIFSDGNVVRTLWDAMVALCGSYWSEPDNITGGCLHIVLDDGNTDDASIRSAAEYADNEGDFRAVAIAVYMYGLPAVGRDRFIEESGRFSAEESTL